MDLYGFRFGLATLKKCIPVRYITKFCEIYSLVGLLVKQEENSTDLKKLILPLFLLDPGSGIGKNPDPG